MGCADWIVHVQVMDLVSGSCENGDEVSGSIK